MRLFCTDVLFLLQSPATRWRRPGPRAGNIGRLIEKSWHALEPGGLLIVHDFMVNQQKTGPTLAALWCLPMLLGNPEAVAITPELMIGLLKERGFVELTAREMIPDITSLVLATRP